jgi:hypothetical protein
VLDRDLDSSERSELHAQLTFVEQQSGDSDLHRLAIKLREFLASDDLRLVPLRTTFTSRFASWLQSIEDRWLQRKINKYLLIGCLFGLAWFALDNMAKLVLASIDAGKLTETVIDLLSVGGWPNIWSTSVFSMWVGMEGAIGLTLILAASLLFFGLEHSGFRLSHRALLVYIVIVNVLVFYYHQFFAIVLAGFQFFVLWVLNRYQYRHLS